MSVLIREQQRLSIALQQHQPRTIKALNLNDRFVLISCLQKALRRGDGHVAIGAARALLHIDPVRLWRRLVICVFEDFGLADLDLTVSTVAAAADKRWRSQVGGDDHVMTYLIERMMGCPRDRRVDSLYMRAVRPPSQSDYLALQPSVAVADLIHKAETIVARCENEVPRRAFRAVVASQCDQSLQIMANDGIVDNELHAVCAQGRRTSMCLLPVLLPLVKRAKETVGSSSTVLSRDIPEVRSIGDVPSYALCGFTRLGQKALTELARSDRDVARLVRSLKGRARMATLTYILFEVEGGACTLELSDPLSDELKHLSLGSWTSPPREAVQDAIKVMRAAIPALNDIRQELWSSRMAYSK